jgi:glucosamine-6-phosphate deaminase
LAEVVFVGSQAAAGTLVAASIRSLIAQKPDAVLGLATGSTPLSVYSALASSLAADPLDVSRVRGFALDEYVGLPSGHPESYRAVITRDVVVPLGLTPANIQVPNGDLATIQTAGADYEASITRIKTLAEKTRIDNARFFASPDEVPIHCITQGLGTILRARHLVLLAFGLEKAEAIAAAVEGPVTSSKPGSVIQLHPHVTVIVDEAAASHLTNLAYYKYAWAHKDAWQGI